MAKDRKWTGTERFEAIKGAIGTVLPARESLAGDLASADRLSLESAIDGAIGEAARASGATEQQVSDWLESFATLGRAGLTQNATMNDELSVADLTGTWELESHIVDGERLSGAGYIYYDDDIQDDEATQLVTMWTEDPETGAETQYVALARHNFTQNGPFKVDVSTAGEFMGNFGGVAAADGFEANFSLVRRGNNEAMIGVSQAARLGDSGYSLPCVMSVSGNAGALVFTSLGSPATADSPRVPDVVDTYLKVSDKKPLVAGLEPVAAYFERARAQFQGAAAGASLASFR